jgi:death-on-curing protein
LDGNKRIGHAAMEIFLVLNGFEIAASVDEQEEVVLRIASGKMNREELATWLRAHLIQKSG